MPKPSHLQKLRHLPEPARKSVCTFINRCGTNGNTGKVLIETLRFLSKPPGTGTLIDTRKQLRPKVRALAHPSPKHPRKRALSQESAKLLLTNLENEFDRRLTSTSSGLLLGHLYKEVYYRDLMRLDTLMKRRRVYGPFSI